MTMLTPFDMAHRANSDPRAQREQAEYTARHCPIDARHDYTWPRPTVRSVLAGKVWHLVGGLALGFTFAALAVLAMCAGGR